MSATTARLAANPRELPGALVAVCILLMLLGAGAFVLGLSSDPAVAWRAFHVNVIYFGTLSQAAVVLASALVIIGARWCGPIRHVAEGLAAWVPISLVLLLISSWFGREYIYTNWLHTPPPGKEWWLSFPRVFWTDLAILTVYTVLTLVYLRTSFRPTLAGAAERATRAKGMFASWTSGWRGDEVERAESERRLKRLAPILCLTYAFAISIVAFDQVMSLTPTFFSTIFGWYYLWGGFLGAVAATALISVLLRANVPGWDVEITHDRMHDLGKMIFAFSIFWMYLFFAQYIVIWYGNLPEETQFINMRLGTGFLQDTWFFLWDRFDEPYVRLSMAAWIGCWWVPFWVLLGERPKRTPVILGGVAATVLLGFWLERNALVWASLVPADGMAWLGLVQIGIGAGFLGAFVLVYLIFSRVFPTLPLPKR
ncbi:MAG TPA: hypothetical protein VFY49_07920 [Myxococcota bacterium]|nr:hypothetical protein [Myxococcota bacterium]